MRVPDRAARLVSGWRGDAAVAAVLIVFLFAFMLAHGSLHGAGNLLEAGCATAIACALILRRGHPELAASVAAGCLALTLLGSPAVLPDSSGLVPTCLLTYSLGTSPRRRRSLVFLLILGAVVQLAVGAAQFNPFILIVVFLPWAAGLTVASRRKLTEQLAARGRELAAERALFAAEAVRYERARIARELHDIVAHSVSVMVIQASAGQRLTATDPALAAEAFDSIGEVARQAGTEIGLLVDLLDQGAQQPAAEGIQLVGELVARAAAAGLAVSCRFTGSAAGLGPQSSAAAYRVVQESLTNAFKHAPGVPVEVVITESDGQVQIGVVNGATPGSPSGLEHAGGGHGLTGMAQRVAACGGEVTAGPAAGGGWSVHARLPLHPGQPLTSPLS